MVDFLSANSDEATIFDAAMAGRASDQAAAISAGGDLTGVSHIVDVGGGRGAMLAETLQANPELTGVLADRAEVAAAAEAYFAEVGLSDRARAVTDRLLRHCSRRRGRLHPGERTARLARSGCHPSPANRSSGDAPSARLWIIERVVDAAGRNGHELRDLHLIDLHLLVVFGARERTTAEYDALMRSAGLSPGRLLPTHGPGDSTSRLDPAEPPSPGPQPGRGGLCYAAFRLPPGAGEPEGVEPGKVVHK